MNGGSANPAMQRLGRRMRQLRDHAQLTGPQLAALLGGSWRPPKISKIENGRQLPSEHETEEWAAATGGDPAELVRLRGAAAVDHRSHGARHDAAGGAVAFQDRLAELVESCTRLGEFQPMLVPGRLQTAHYIRALAATGTALTEGEDPEQTLGRVIAMKLRRQALLYEPGREFVHVVTEAALRLRIGSATPEVQRGQLAHLAELATLPGHTFAVLPFDRPCPVFPTGFALYDRDLVRVETSAGVLELTDAVEVEQYARRLDRLVDASLVGAEAADLCRTVAAALPD